MQIGRIEHATRMLGRLQGYKGLPVRDEQIHDQTTGTWTYCMTTAWHPTPAELTALMLGAAVHVRLIGKDHPPITVGVGEVPV
jgi:hypothetical protein